MAITRCPYCHAIIDETDKYCNNCGTQLLFPEDDVLEEEIPGEKIIDAETEEKDYTIDEPEEEKIEYVVGDEDGESGEGTWEVIGDSMKIVEEVTNSIGEVEKDSIIFSYEVNENILTLTYTEAETDPEELQEIEFALGLESGSLSKIEARITLVFSSEVSKPGFRKSRYSLWPGRSVIKQIIKDGIEKRRFFY